MSEMKDRMLRGELYIADDPALAADNTRAQALLERFNATTHDERDGRPRLLRELLGSVGENVVIRPPFRCDYGTYITIGAGAAVTRDLPTGVVAVGNPARVLREIGEADRVEAPPRSR